MNFHFLSLSTLFTPLIKVVWSVVLEGLFNLEIGFWSALQQVTVTFPETSSDQINDMTLLSFHCSIKILLTGSYFSKLVPHDSSWDHSLPMHSILCCWIWEFHKPVFDIYPIGEQRVLVLCSSYPNISLIFHVDSCWCLWLPLHSQLPFWQLQSLFDHMGIVSIFALVNIKRIYKVFSSNALTKTKSQCNTCQVWMSYIALLVCIVIC